MRKPNKRLGTEFVKKPDIQIDKSFKALKSFKEILGLEFVVFVVLISPQNSDFSQLWIQFCIGFV